MTLGLISDTHSHFDPRLPTLFAGVDLILHAGDIGTRTVLDELGLIAPVTAVLGNNDTFLELRDFEVVKVGTTKLLLHHIVHPHSPSPALQRRLLLDQPDVVVSGHSHRRCALTVGRTFYLNPGYAGHPRFGAARSVALLHCTDDILRPEFIDL